MEAGSKPPGSSRSTPIPVFGASTTERTMTADTNPIIGGRDHALRRLTIVTNGFQAPMDAFRAKAATTAKPSGRSFSASRNAKRASK